MSKKLSELIRPMVHWGPPIELSTEVLRGWLAAATELEANLAQAQADVQALMRVDTTAEKLILSIGYPKDRLLVAKYTSAKAALPERLKEKTGP